MWDSLAVERGFHMPEVTGSNPVPTTNIVRRPEW